MLEEKEQIENENLIEDLLKQSRETEWIEFKENNSSPDTIGETLSALSNGANIHNKSHGYLVFGVNNDLIVTGTTFKPKKEKKGNEELENWLLHLLSPRPTLEIIEFNFRGKNLVILKVLAAIDQPVLFSGISWIRIGSLNKKLKDFPNLEGKIWQNHNRRNFEKQIALSKQTADDVLKLLNYPIFFTRLEMPLPENKQSILEKLLGDKIINKNEGLYDITNLGAILLARNLRDFNTVMRKAPRVIFYKNKDKTETVFEQEGNKGYITSYPNLIEFIKDRLPSNEEIGSSLRVEQKMYPDIAIRELIANALIHQDFFKSGTGPMIEIYKDRMEITNPGKPIVEVDRFIDYSPQSRNEDLAALMRRCGICEERGSGIDKVIRSIELFQLPAPKFEANDDFTKVTLYSYKKIKDMDAQDKIRACFQHCVLMYVSNETMNNASLRKRFNIDKKNYSIISRIIRETQKVNLIKIKDPSMTSRKYISYVPFWA